MPRGRVSTVLLSLLLLPAGTTLAAQSADSVFLNGAVYTVNPGQPWASAVAVRNGRITFVGNDKEAQAFIGADTEAIDLEGRMLMPGFHDSHMHPMAAGTRFLRCQLYDLEWPEEVLAKLKECESSLGEGQWLRGVGLADEAFDDGRMNKSLLDEIAPGHPAIVTGHYGHVAWVSSRALELGGIDKSTPDPKDGLIERDTENLEPTGVLRDSAVNSIWNLHSEYEPDEYREALRLASQMANRFGITSSDESSARADHVEAYIDAQVTGEMTLRVNASMRWNSELGAEQLEKFTDLRDRASGPRFRAEAIKLFLDGSMNSSASMLSPFAGTTDDFGSSNFGDQLEEVVSWVDAAGFQVHMHAYGDRAVRDGLDAIEKAFSANPLQERRHQMAHVALIDPADLPRFARLGVTADIQPLWAWLDEDRLAEIEILGPDRSTRLMAFHDLFESGARVVAGSDWISDSMNPLYNIQIAVTRRPPDGSGPAWLPEQRVSLEQMIQAYTINGAWLARQENLTGSIEVGKAADLIVLEQNLFEVDSMKLKDVKVLLTLLEGAEVHRAPGF